MACFDALHKLMGTKIPVACIESLGIKEGPLEKPKTTEIVEVLEPITEITEEKAEEKNE